MNDSKKQTWENFGDVDPLEGGVYVQQDGDTTYRVIKVEYWYDTEDDKPYRIADCYIDMDDIEGSWIEKDRVMSFIGMTEKDFDPIWFMLGAIDYYGPMNFGDDRFNTFLSEEEVLTQLKAYGIEV